jgi:Asp-tRNA(Asn)/Glu-tRNA(Gln) amidotransferase A subunit family amidase
MGRFGLNCLLTFLAFLLVIGCGSDEEEGCIDTNASRPTIDITEKSVDELQDAMSECQVNAVQLVNGFLERIETYDSSGPRIRSMITVMDRNEALRLAKALDKERRASGPRSMLHGIPVLVKDSIDVEGLPTSGGTTVLKDAHPANDAFLVNRLKEAGAVVLGKTNLDELQKGGVGLSTLGDQTLNPYAPNRIPGGSSAGSAAGIAANFAVIGIGADTQGSIRYPAMHNNLCALRPTRGLISGHGSLPGSVMNEVKGPMTRTMCDLAHTLDVISGRDPEEPITSLGEPHIPEGGYRSFLDADGLEGARIAYIGNFIHIPSSQINESTAQVLEVSNQVLADLERAGATLVRIDLTEEHLFFEKIGEMFGTGSIGKQRLLWDRYLSDLNGVTFNHYRDFLVQGMSQLFLKQPPLERIVNRGAMLLSAFETYDPDIEAAKNQKQLEIQEDLAAYMDSEDLRVDAILITSYSKMPLRAADGGLKPEPSDLSFPFLVNDILIGLSSYTGLPSLVLPAGFTSDGVPIGFQLVGRAFSEARLIEMGYAYEQTTMHRRLPNLTPVLSGA